MESIRQIRPLPTLAGYIGGKRALAKRLGPLIEAVEHRCYCEPFFGMGGVFFRRRQAAKVEVINDLSRDIANLFRMVQRHPEALFDLLRYQVAARPEFDRLAATDPGTLTDLERAARFLMLQKMAFGGLARGRSFGVDTTWPARVNVRRLAELIDETHARLQGVFIECLPWANCIDRYDRGHTLFYLDPPYWGSESDYGKGMFARSDFDRLAARLRGLKGRFILTVNDTPETRAIFAGFAVRTLPVPRFVSGVTPSRDLVVTDAR